MADPAQIEEALAVGAQKARRIAVPFIQALRQAVGIRKLSGSANQTKSPQGAAKSAKAARYVSFRDQSGRFRFRLLAADGTELFCSVAYDDPKQAGLVRQQLQQGVADDFLTLPSDTDFSLQIEGELVAVGTASKSQDQRDSLLELLRIAMTPAAG